MAKASKLEMAEREEMILNLIDSGYSPKRISEEVALKYKINERTVLNHYYQLVKGMGKVSEARKEEMRGVLLLRQEALYRQAASAGSLKAANDILMSQAKLLGLNEKIEQKQDRPAMITVSEKDMSGKLEVVPTDKAENE